MPCDHQNLAEILDRLEPYQGGKQRHICAGCAFLLGVEHREKGKPFNPGAIEVLPESQASHQRHKNAYQAYLLGYQGRV